MIFTKILQKIKNVETRFDTSNYDLDRSLPEADLGLLQHPRWSTL